MKKQFLSITSAVFALAVLFASCGKKPVTPPEEHNHDDPSKVVMKFIRGHYHGTKLHGVDTTTVALRWDGKFIDPVTSNLLSAPPVVHMKKRANDICRLEITFLAADGDTINGEFLHEADEHQFFFIPQASGVDALTYTYKDADNARVGLTGDFKVLTEDKTFDLLLSLRHGIDKKDGKTYEWNDPKYNTYGSADFAATIKVVTELANDNGGH